MNIAVKTKSAARRAINKLGTLFFGQNGFLYEDGLITVHNSEFKENPQFIAAYQRGIKACKEDYHFRWRVHVALWAAAHAKSLPGEFVECGVNRGFLSSAVMAYLNWNTLDKRFFLFDTFCGIVESQISEEESALGRHDSSKALYSECYEEVKRNFSEFKNVIMVRGAIPATLDSPAVRQISQIAYLSIDMNCAAPEIAAARFFWDKMVKGAVAILDDYAFHTDFRPQMLAFNEFAQEKDIQILTLPTGQGLFIKS